MGTIRHHHNRRIKETFMRTTLFSIAAVLLMLSSSVAIAKEESKPNFPEIPQVGFMHFKNLKAHFYSKERLQKELLTSNINTDLAGEIILPLTIGTKNTRTVTIKGIAGSGSRNGTMIRIGGKTGLPIDVPLYDTQTFKYVDGKLQMDSKGVTISKQETINAYSNKADTIKKLLSKTNKISIYDGLRTEVSSIQLALPLYLDKSFDKKQIAFTNNNLSVDNTYFYHHYTKGESIGNAWIVPKGVTITLTYSYKDGIWKSDTPLIMMRQYDLTRLEQDPALYISRSLKMHPKVIIELRDYRWIGNIHLSAQGVKRGDVVFVRRLSDWGVRVSYGTNKWDMERYSGNNFIFDGGHWRRGISHVAEEYERMKLKLYWNS